MKVLVLVHEVGSTASGIISLRVIEELVNQGYDVVVVTSKSVKVDGVKVVCCKDFIPSSTFFSRVIRKLKRIIGLDIFNGNYCWRIRAYFKSLKMISKWRPDFIYCRTSPIDPCFVGIRLKNRFHIPLLVNLTDPLPPPLEYLPEGKVRRNLLENASVIISHADLIAMGTEQALKYQIKETGIDFSSKAFISPDPVPYATIKTFNVNKSTQINLVYLGSIYGPRNIVPLIEAIKRINAQGYAIKFKIYGKVPLSIHEDFIEEYGFVAEVENALSDADILVDIDGDDVEPVFISSKLKQYLVVNRHILSITPLNSPTSKLLQNIDSVSVVSNDVDNIQRVISQIIEHTGTYNYNDRVELINNLSPKAVVDNIISEVSSRLIVK